MPRGQKKGIRGEGLGAELARKAKIVGSTASGLENDPDIIAARGQEIEDERELDNPQTAMDAAMAALEAVETDVRAHPIGNGQLVPLPWDGENTTNVTTCSKPIKDVNRGCPEGRRCPAVGKGPFNVVYLNKRTNRVKTCFCTQMAGPYQNVPWIQILPGVDWIPTRKAEYAPLPNGQQPTPGPGQARTPIVLTPHKTKLVCVLPTDLATEWQKKRRRGDFLKG